jgi:hypothetical protein
MSFATSVGIDGIRSRTAEENRIKDNPKDKGSRKSGELIKATT